MWKKSLFCFMKEVKNHSFNITISLFDTYVSPVLNYCNELWGYVNAQDIERVLMVFLKWLLGVKPSTSSYETGSLPLVIQRQFNIFKYWLKLLKTDNYVLKGLYEKVFHAHSDMSSIVQMSISRLH